MSVQEMIRVLLAIGFTEEAIAVGVKVHKSTISRIFTGKTTSPRYRLVNEIEVIFMKYANKVGMEN
jgi:transcriptional regulator with XRE-family HTH domain